MLSACLWIVAAPLGNPDDLSPRARSVLAEADLILAEDTRRAKRLLAGVGIAPKRMLSFFEHNENERRKETLVALENGESVALISDAGTPLLADPGYRLVRECRRLGIKVSPVPGPSAITAALSAAGIAPIPFTFLGFLPRSVSSRRELFETCKSVPGSLVFFERKDRLAESLDLAAQILGEREAAICRELTKTHEEFIISQLSEAASRASGLSGEITAIIGPAAEMAKSGHDEAEKALLAALSSGLKPRDAARETRKIVRGWNVSELYSLIQSLKQT